jgi:lysophospholipase L1-like esterase
MPPCTRVLALGDSLTAGSTSFVGGGKKYPLRPYAPALQHHMNWSTIQYRGSPGASSDALRHGMRGTHGLLTLLQQGEPFDLVLLWMGANDVLQAVSSAPSRASTILERLAQNVGAMHGAVYAAGATPIALGVPDMSHGASHGPKRWSTSRLKPQHLRPTRRSQLGQSARSHA